MNPKHLDENYLVNRAYNSLERLHENKKRPQFPQPDIITKDRKTFFINFSQLCQSIDRTQDYLKR